MGTEELNENRGDVLRTQDNKAVLPGSSYSGLTSLVSDC